MVSLSHSAQSQKFESSQLILLHQLYRSVVNSHAGQKLSKQDLTAKIGKRMSAKIHGKTQVASRIKAEATCRWVLDNGWSYGGFRWGLKPGHHAKLVKSSRGSYFIAQIPTVGNKKR